MSYEGRQQIWCERGHYFVTDCHDDLTGWSCKVCGGDLATRNGVDDTNGEADGYIEPVIATPAVMCKCECCGNSHVRLPAVYQIPESSP